MKRKIILVLFSVLCLCTLTGCNKVKIALSETSKIEYEKFDNGLVRLDIPKGWKVEVSPNGSYATYSFKVYNPENKDYMMLFALKLSGFLKSEAARKKFHSLYPTAAFGLLAAVDPQTTEGFYKVWNENAKISNDAAKNSYFPIFKDFEVIDNLGKVSLGGDILRATFKNDKNEDMQGLFTTTVYSAGTYTMYGYDFAPLSCYHTIMLTAPDAEFNNWASIYDHTVGSIEFTDKFMTGFNKEEQNMVSTVQANAKIYDQISDMIMDSWEKRSASYDIISQKRSDATLGYERVYDTETNEVVTDDMYIKAISGYIEK